MLSWLRNHRIGWVAAILALVAPATATDAVAGGKFDSRLDTIANRGVLTVCSTGDYRPFSFRDPGGNWGGVDVDMAADLATDLGVRLVFVQSTFATIATDVGAKCDVAMGGISITLARARTPPAFSPTSVLPGLTGRDHPAKHRRNEHRVFDFHLRQRANNWPLNGQ
jgi:cyclohexadienyl dehydratase